MSKAFTILRRELQAYFTGPIGYIYLVAFLFFTNAYSLMFVRNKPFFEFPVADMRYYFDILAGVTALLVAAITMRAWSEERKENTFEMLLTFPMRPAELVAGKFLACLSFYTLALIGTLTVPLMMVMFSRSAPDAAVQLGFWGQLDIGPVLSGYLGCFLLGALFIAFGLFISSLCSDQIVAFVLTAPVLLSSFILGTPKIVEDLNKMLSFTGSTEMGTYIGSFFGIYGHFSNLSRGLVLGADLLFFVLWIAVFLLLNGFAIERRSRPNANMLFASAAVLLVLIGCVGNLLTQRDTGRLAFKRVLGRMDVTGDKVFTIDPISSKVLNRLEDVVTVRYVVTPRHKLPVQMQDLERDVRDKLEALRLISGGKLRYEIVYQETVDGLVDESEEKKDEADGKDLRERLLKDIRPFGVAAREGEAETIRQVFSGILISLGEDRDVLNPLMQENLPQLEYQLIKFIDKMTREKQPVIALVAPLKELDPQMAAMYQQFGRPVPPPEDPYQYLPYYLQHENFEVRRVRLNEQDNLPPPEEYDVLVVVGPENLNDRQQWEIARALYAGKPTFMAVQENAFDYRTTINGISATLQPLKPNANRILRPSGITVGEAMLMDMNAVPVEVPMQTPFGYLPQPYPSDLRMHSELKGDSFNLKHTALQGVPQLRYIWGTTLGYDEKDLKAKEIQVTPLLISGSKCWTRSVSGPALTQADIAPPRSEERYQRFPLAAMFEGQFKNAFAGEERPEWPAMPGRPPQPGADDAPAGPVTPAPGKLILVANARMFHRDFIQYPELTFFLNCVGTLGLDEEGQAIRKLKDKSYQIRTIPDISDRSISLWKFVQFGLAPLGISAAGIAVFVLRQQRRDRYADSLKSA